MEDDVPKKLFRYRPLHGRAADREIDAIERRYLWFSPFKDLNDPSEICEAQIKGSSIELEQGLSLFLPSSHSSQIAQVMRNRAQMAATGFFLGKEDSGVCCFSSRMDHQALWAYYASNFSGMCLEFSVSTLVSQNDFCWGNRMMSVEYSSEREVNLSESLSPTGRQNHVAVVTKHPDWSHEEEWRCFVKGWSGKNFYLGEALKAIYIGPKATEHNTDRLEEVCMKSNINLSQVMFSGHRLELEEIYVAKDASPISFDKKPRGRLFSSSHKRLLERRPYLANRVAELECIADGSASTDQLGGVIFNEEEDSLILIVGARLGNGEETVRVIREEDIEK